MSCSIWRRRIRECKQPPVTLTLHCQIGSEKFWPRGVIDSRQCGLQTLSQPWARELQGCEACGLSDSSESADRQRRQGITRRATRLAAMIAAPALHEAFDS